MTIELYSPESYVEVLTTRASRVILCGSRVIADVVNVRSCCIRVGLDPITDVLRKIRTQRHAQWRKSCEDRGRNWSNGSTSQGM